MSCNVTSLADTNIVALPDVPYAALVAGLIMPLALAALTMTSAGLPVSPTNDTYCDVTFGVSLYVPGAMWIRAGSRFVAGTDASASVILVNTCAPGGALAGAWPVVDTYRSVPAPGGNAGGVTDVALAVL